MRFELAVLTTSADVACQAWLVPLPALTSQPKDTAGSTVSAVMEDRQVGTDLEGDVVHGERALRGFELAAGLIHILRHQVQPLAGRHMRYDLQEAVMASIVFC